MRSVANMTENSCNASPNHGPLQTAPLLHPRNHCNCRLADLYNHNRNAPRAVNDQANSAVDALAEHNERLFDLESHWHNSVSVGETLAPSRVTTTTQALSATNTLLQQPVQQVVALSARPVAAPVAAAQAPWSGNDSSTSSSCNTPKTWCQWDMYCYRCGINLNHTTAGCNFVNMLAGKDRATKDNPLGGNIKKNHLWMKWCHPVTNKVHDVRE